MADIEKIVLSMLLFCKNRFITLKFMYLYCCSLDRPFVRHSTRDFAFEDLDDIYE